MEGDFELPPGRDLIEIGIDCELNVLIDQLSEQEECRTGDVIEWILKDWFSRGFDRSKGFTLKHDFYPVISFKKFECDNESTEGATNVQK